MTEPQGDEPADVTAAAVVHPDGAAEVELDGVVQGFAPGSVLRVAGDITEYVAERAAADDAPIRVDLQAPDGDSTLLVHPDATVEEVGATPSATPGTSGPPTSDPAGTLPGA